jgi:hypothetical protein
MVPLERVTTGSTTAERILVPRKQLRRRRREAEQPKPRPPRKFKIVDVITRRALAEGATTREAAATLKNVRSMVDVNVYVWQEDDQRWRLVTLAEQRALWDLARR